MSITYLDHIVPLCMCSLTTVRPQTISTAAYTPFGRFGQGTLNYTIRLAIKTVMNMLLKAHESSNDQYVEQDILFIYLGKYRY